MPLMLVVVSLFMFMLVVVSFFMFMLIVMGLFMLVLLFASLQLVQIVKRLLGFELYDFEEESDWPPADQLMYLSQEVPDEQTGQWPIEQWSGIRAGQGLSREHSWRNDD